MKNKYINSSWNLVNIYLWKLYEPCSFNFAVKQTKIDIPTNKDGLLSGYYCIIIMLLDVDKTHPKLFSIYTIKRN